MKNHINNEQLKKVANSIWMSKARYGLQLYGVVRRQESDKKASDFAALQVAQNNLLRTLENVRIKDKRSVEKMLDNQNMLSIIQTQAHIKLVEMWKAKYNQNYPIPLENIVYPENAASTRGVTAEKFRINNTPNTFIGDATRLWNKAPDTVRTPQTLNGAKIASKIYCKTLPV